MTKKGTSQKILTLVNRAGAEGVNTTGLMVLLLVDLGIDRPGKMVSVLRKMGGAVPFPTISLQLHTLGGRGLLYRERVPATVDQRASIWRITAAGLALLECSS